MKIFIALALFAVTANANLFDFSNNWNNLRVKWGLNPLSSFKTVPRHLNEIGSFELKDDQCNGGKFLGQRYWSKSDPSVILLFDKNGYIAGMQTSTPKSKFTPAHLKDRNFIDDGDYWTLTTYFVPPSSICTTGRTKEQFEKEGTGSGLWVQIGPNPLTDTMEIPRDEAEIKKTNWGHGKCFKTMGQHYWYNVSADMSCDDFFPKCLLYNKGKLTGFCFALNADLQSDRYDNPHPTAEVINKFMDPMPKCFATDPTYKLLSTIHVYFIEHPLASWC